MIEFNTKNLNVAVIMGGISAEREVSLRSGIAIVKSLKKFCQNVEAIDGVKAFLESDFNQFDAVFNILHGEAGENGELAGLLSSLGIKYTGCNLSAAAVSWNKDFSKTIVANHNIKTPQSQLISKASELKIKNTGPWIVKPNQEGSSVGLFYSENEIQLKNNITEALSKVNTILVEDFIKGTECTVSIVKGKALPVIKIIPKVGLYDYDAKYESGNTGYFCPSGYDSKLESSLQKDALKAYNALGLSGWARIDFMVDESSQHWFLEANTTPGMTETSLVPKAAKAIDWNFDELVLQILSTAFIKDNGVPHV